jgi:ribosomal protein S18 acetylase RimI-like enzyme
MNREEFKLVIFEADNEYHSKMFYKLNIDWLLEFFGPDKIFEYDYNVMKNPYETLILKDGAVFFAEVNNEIAGTIGLFKRPEEIYEIVRFGVDSKHRGKGLGKFLLTQILNLCRQKNISKVYLTTHSNLEYALNLYKKTGFVESIIDLHSKKSRPDKTMELEL